jgi:hypothetical protein
VSLGCPFFVLFVFLLCLVPNIACVEWTTQRHRQYWAQDRGGRQIKQRMDNPETQAILSTRQRRNSLFYLFSSSALCLILPVSLGCPFFVLFVFLLCLVLNIACVSERRKTNKTKNGQPRDTGNIRHKTQDEDK